MSPLNPDPRRVTTDLHRAARPYQPDPRRWANYQSETDPMSCGAEECPNCTSEYVDCPDGCQTCDNWYAEMVGRPKGRYVVWFENDVDESGNVRPAAISDVCNPPGQSPSGGDA